MGTGRQAYSRLTDDKRVIYYHELPTGTPRHRQRHYHLLAFPPPSFLSVALPSSSFLYHPPSPFLPQPGGGSSNYPSSPPAPLPLPSLLPRPRRARPASFIRRKIHLHNGPHAHRLLTRSIRIVYTPSWKLTSSTTTRTYVNNMYIQGYVLAVSEIEHVPSTRRVSRRARYGFLVVKCHRLSRELGIFAEHVLGEHQYLILVLYILNLIVSTVE